MATQEAKNDVYPILLLGDSKVGKTCFLLRYCDNMFQENHLTTMGLDFKLKEVELNSNKNIMVKIWDTAGQERFKSLTKNFYKNVSGIALLYDVTKKDTFDNINNWLKQIKDKASDDVRIILIGNKLDAMGDRQVATDDGIKLAAYFKLPFFETSAKEDINVKESIKTLVRLIYDRKIEDKKDINLNNKKKAKEGGCCS